MLIKYTCDSKSQRLRMRYPFQSTGRPISHRNGWTFRVYMIPLRDFVPEWNFRPDTRTGVNSRRGDSRRHDILWWYYVNKYRALTGNRSELAPGRKSLRCHVNTPLIRTVDWSHLAASHAYIIYSLISSGHGQLLYVELFMLDEPNARTIDFAISISDPTRRLIPYEFRFWLCSLSCVAGGFLVCLSLLVHKVMDKSVRESWTGAVSYTHLTLPTSDLV